MYTVYVTSLRPVSNWSVNYYSRALTDRYPKRFEKKVNALKKVPGLICIFLLQPSSLQGKRHSLGDSVSIVNSKII